MVFQYPVIPVPRTRRSEPCSTTTSSRDICTRVICVGATARSEGGSRPIGSAGSTPCRRTRRWPVSRRLASRACSSTEGLHHHGPSRKNGCAPHWEHRCSRVRTIDSCIMTSRRCGRHFDEQLGADGRRALRDAILAPITVGYGPGFYGSEGSLPTLALAQKDAVLVINNPGKEPASVGRSATLFGASGTGADHRASGRREPRRRQQR